MPDFNAASFFNKATNTIRGAENYTWGKRVPQIKNNMSTDLPKRSRIGKGINMQADLMVGNLGGQVGQVVRKLPIHAIPPKALAAEAGNLQLAQTIISKLLKGSNK